jgi:hypothetical protein
MNFLLNRAPCRAFEARGNILPIGEIMESTVQKSCWGVTARAVCGFAAVLVIAYLFGGI